MAAKCTWKRAPDPFFGASMYTGWCDTGTVRKRYRIRKYGPGRFALLTSSGLRSEHKSLAAAKRSAKKG